MRERNGERLRERDFAELRTATPGWCDGYFTSRRSEVSGMLGAPGCWWPVPKMEHVLLDAEIVARTEVLESRPSVRLSDFYKSLTTRLLDSPLSIAFVVVATYGLAVYFQEKIQACGGFGHDGCTYGAWAMDFAAHVMTRNLNDYQAQRVFPAAAMHLAMRLFGVTRTVTNVIVAFEVANALLVFLCALSFCASATRLHLTRSTRWLGAACLFGSFAIIKWSAYYPVLTDVWAFAFGAFQLQFYLSRQRIALLVSAILGGFTWPTLMLVGSCLLFFVGVDRHASTTRRAARLHQNDIFAVIIPGVCLFAFGPPVGRLAAPLARLSVLVAAAFMFWGLRIILDDRRLFDPRPYLRGLFTVSGVLAVMALVGVTLLRKSWLANSAEAMDWRYFVEDNVKNSTRLPGVFALAHTLFFGPLFMLTCMQWQRCARIIQRYGMGLVVISAFAIFAAWASESRKLINFVPMLAPFALKALDDLRPHPRRLIELAAISVFSSKLWLAMDGQLAGSVYEFPAQTLFMSAGPWMNVDMYVIQGTVALIVAYWMRRWLLSASPAALQKPHSGDTGVAG